MIPAANQARTFLRLLGALRPHWRTDFALPARIQSLLSREKSFGSRDRRLYRELIYTTLRYLPWIEPWLDRDGDEAVRRVACLAADLPATREFRSVWAKGDISAGNRAELLPAWFSSHCPELFAAPELDAQLRRAPLWLRLQTDAPDAVFAEFDALGWSWCQPKVLPSAIELRTEADVTRTDGWRNGAVEVQDLGSQLLLPSVGVAPAGTWLDACAGAGGKTLQLARLVGPAGRVDASDIRPAALQELAQRATRAGLRVAFAAAGDGPAPSRPATAAAIRILDRAPADQYDGVLVDAPCSGSGTWRRAPHLKWVTTAADVHRAAERQRTLLHQLSARVRPGGRLIYATCSLSRRENEDVIGAFLDEHREFEPASFVQTFGFTVRGAGLTVLPSRHDSDGFFVAPLRRS